MLSLPDLREKQIIFVTPADVIGDALTLKNENIHLQKADGTKNRISCHKALALFIVGDCTITTKLLRKCREHGVSVFMLNTRFRTICAAPAMAEGNYALRMRQYDFKEDLAVAKNIVANKISNQLGLLKAGEYSPESQKIITAVLQKIETAQSAESLRGLEGNAAKVFFGEYFKEQKWYRRMPRTKVDVPNLLLDMGYTMLFNIVDSCVSLHGFDTYKGVYHQLFFQRKSLVCDLMEPFRCLIDKELKKAYNLKRINDGDFEFSQGSYILPYDKQGKYVSFFAKAVMRSKEDIFTYVRDYYYCILNDNSNYPIYRI